MQIITARKERKGSSSNFIGISWDKRRGGWWAKFNANGKRYDLGVWPDELQAARIYNSAAVRFGKPLNVLPPEEGHSRLG